MVKIVNNKIKIVLILMVAFQIMFMPISNGFSLNDILTQGDEFLETGKNNQYEERIDGTEVPLLDQSQLKETVNDVYNILLTLGIVISVLVGAILGIRYITSSAGDQAKIKETLVPYVVGCIVVFGAFGIWKIAINIGAEVNSITDGNTSAYIVRNGKWYWCMGCDRELTESEKKDQQCSKSKSHEVKYRTERYFCSKCGDEWDEGERRQQGCDQCRSK